MFQFTRTKLARAAALATVMSLVTTIGGSAMAAAPMAKTAAPGYFRLMLGAFEVTALSDGTVDLPVDQLLSASPATTKQALSASFLSAPLETSVNAYLINTGSKLVLIDTGAASLFGPTLGKLLANLKASGYEPAQIDEIYLTHLHPDHVGGLISNGMLAFPNATIRADRRESEFWLSQANMERAPDASKGFFQGAMSSLNPYVAVEKFLPFAGDTELVPGIKSSSSYGHTAGHTSYVIESQGKKLLLVGDLIHVAAVQLDNPAVTIVFDGDPKAAAAARGKAFTQAAREGALVGASHIQFPGLGHLRSAGTSYQWLPVNYTQMR
ncbi:glyoxylase-like metal-dependent hydrolase (beta-lactamase superfamily II) [Oxalobacteraceae bacterium GrIS 1.11]